MIKTILTVFIGLLSMNLVAKDINFNKIKFINSKGVTFVSNDNGNTWKQSKKKKLNFDKQVFINSKGVVYKSKDNGNTWLAEDDDIMRDTISPLIVSPNPVLSKSITLKFLSLSTGEAFIRIFNNQSNDMLHQKKYPVTFGMNELNIGLSNDFIIGSYYILMTIDDDKHKIAYKSSFIIK